MSEIIESSGKTIMQLIVDNLLIPMILAVIPVILFKVQGYFKKMMESTTAKNEKEALSAVATITTQVLEQVKSVVETAVAEKMDLVKKLKSESPDGQLSETDAERVHKEAEDLVGVLLPTNARNILVTTLGSEDKLDKLIYGLIKEAVIKIKSQM